MRSIEPSEHQIQCAIVDWANITSFYSIHTGKEEKIGEFLIAIPNGGNRSITEAIRLKKEGVKKGVSDLFLSYPKFCLSTEKYSALGLWIECKSKKGIVSKFQNEWISLMQIVGFKAIIVRNVDEGINSIKDYLGIK